MLSSGYRRECLTLCPACKQQRNGEPRGFVFLNGDFFSAHSEEIEQLLRNEARRAAEDNPFVDEWDEIQGDRIVIMVGEKPDDHKAHSIGHPTQVSLEQTVGGADVALAIKSADGVTALLRFLSPMLPEMVDGLVGQQSQPPL